MKDFGFHVPADDRLKDKYFFNFQVLLVVNQRLTTG